MAVITGVVDVKVLTAGFESLRTSRFTLLGLTYASRIAHARG
jgi:hypothetical protein